MNLVNADISFVNRFVIFESNKKVKRYLVKITYLVLISWV